MMGKRVDARKIEGICAPLALIDDAFSLVEESAPCLRETARNFSGKTVDHCSCGTN